MVRTEPTFMSQGKTNGAFLQIAERVPLEPFISLLKRRQSHNKPLRLIFAGHSVGGAIAELVALRLLAHLSAEPDENKDVI